MNLQVCMPYERCVFNCPMCVARGHKHNYKFDNLYETNRGEWRSALSKAASIADDIVITGECDPTQNANFVGDVVRLIWSDTPANVTKNIEITTHNQKYANAFRNLRHIETITLSVTNAREYLSAWKAEKPDYIANHYRMVILLTKDFNFLNADNFNPMGFDQVTFKTLQYGEDGEVNRWIYENKMDDEHLEEIRKIVDKFNSNGGCSVRLDTSCQTAAGRYEVFRSDGKVYPSWEASEPIR